MIEKIEFILIWGFLFVLSVPALYYLYSDFILKRELRNPPQVFILMIGATLFLVSLFTMMYAALIEQGIGTNWLFVLPMIFGAYLAIHFKKLNQ